MPQADTDPQRNRGLSKTANAQHGMLFTWPDSKVRVFWMHETAIPLTVAFIDQAGRVFQLGDMQPNSDTPHRSRAPAVAALELPQGGFAVRGIGQGSRLRSTRCYE